MLLTENKLRQIIQEEWEKLQLEASARARAMKHQMAHDKEMRKRSSERSRYGDDPSVKRLSDREGIKINDPRRARDGGCVDDDGNSVPCPEDMDD